MQEVKAPLVLKLLASIAPVELEACVCEIREGKWADCRTGLGRGKLGSGGCSGKVKVVLRNP